MHSILPLKENADRSVFLTTYNPSLPQLNSIIRKYFPILTATKRGSEAFKDAPLIVYRCPKNLRDFLVKAKFKQPSQSNKTQPNIISRCNDGRCCTCKFIAHGTLSYPFYNTGEQRKIPHSLSCSSDNLIYLINCKRCIKKIPLSHVNILAKPVVHWENVLGNTDVVSKITLTNQFPFTLINPSIP